MPARTRTTKSPSPPPEPEHRRILDARVLTRIAYAVTGAWLLVVVVEVASAVFAFDYSPNPYIHMAFLTLIGGAFGIQILRDR